MKSPEKAIVGIKVQMARAKRVFCNFMSGLQSLPILSMVIPLEIERYSFLRNTMGVHILMQ